MIGRFLKPSLLVDMIRKQLEIQLDKSVKDFHLFYFNLENKKGLYFIVDNIHYPFESEMLKKIIYSKTRSELPENYTLDAAKISIENEVINCDIFYKDDKNNKTHKLIKL